MMKRGFTLLELIIVIIIVGILAGILFSRMPKLAERARTTEAKDQCGAIRSSQIRYRIEFGCYTDVIDNLDVDAPGSTNNPVRFFNYTVTADATQLCRAQRVCPGETGPSGLDSQNPGGYQYNLTIDENGTLVIDPANMGPGGC